MSVFIDTSALLAVLDADDDCHPEASPVWERIISSDSETFLTTNYVVLELFAVVQRRLGMKAVRTLDQGILPVVTVEWVTPEDHRSGVSALLVSGRRRLSLVDTVSFTVMRRLGLVKCFAFDPHFPQEGFEPLT